MNSFPLDKIIFMVDPDVPELGLEDATLRLTAVQWWGCLDSGNTLVG